MNEEAEQRVGGQMHVIPSDVLGWDVGAVLAQGAALGICPPAIAEPIEAAVVAKPLT